MSENWEVKIKCEFEELKEEAKDAISSVDCNLSGANFPFTLACTMKMVLDTSTVLPAAIRAAMHCCYDKSGKIISQEVHDRLAEILKPMVKITEGDGGTTQ